MTWPTRNFVFLEDQLGGLSYLYQDPVDVVRANKPSDVGPAFERLEDYRRAGYFLAGWASYEMGYVLEPRLAPLLPERLCSPFLEFGVFKRVVQNPINKPVSGNDHGLPADIQNLTASMTEAAYTEKFARVQDYIRAGDTYQINLTFPVQGNYAGSATALYRNLRARQPSHYGGVVDLGEQALVSLSPELFFELKNGRMTLRPMKGTAARARDPSQDAASGEAMRNDTKSQAENLMIVDLLRNDLSRVAKKASVQVPQLFTIETYPTLHQMTSTIIGDVASDTPIAQIFQSLFPCGSVTGAPKIRAMEIIAELEDSPRGAYCGSIGFIHPDDHICFSVAIRTATLQAGKITYGVGSGIVADSHAGDEYQECLLKAQILGVGNEDISDTKRIETSPDLIETFRWDPQTGPVRVAAHRARMASAAEALGYRFDTKTFDRLARDISGNVSQRVRIVLKPNGDLSRSHTDLQKPQTPWRVAMSDATLSLDVQETRYKVSARAFYDGERHRLAAEYGVDEVLFFNKRDELCEGSVTSLFVKKADSAVLLTPTLSCGLLPGVFRAEMIRSGRAREAVLTRSDLVSADEIYVGNSLRGLIPVELASPERL